jgi:hypothetical protein
LIDFFFGKPRSGKSYKAMKYIYYEYISEPPQNTNILTQTHIYKLYSFHFVHAKTPKYRNILTNIGGFKFDKVNQIFLDKGVPNRAYKLVWKDFYKHLKVMYEMAMDDKDDVELNRYATYHLINDCLIVLDESSLYMKKYDDVISWWLAYHGHFKVQIIIIAQGPKQINAEYMTHTEIFYEAQSQSKQLMDSQLRYIHYSDIPFSKDSKFASSTIKTEQKIYDLYKSGEVDKPKKIVYKYIFIFVLAILFVLFFGYKLFNSVSNPKGAAVAADKNISNQLQNVSVSSSGIIAPVGVSLIPIRCDNKKCWNPDSLYLQNEITITYFKFVIDKNKIDLQYTEDINQIYKLTQMERGSAKSTIYSLSDFYYYFSDDVKKNYLKELFILKPILSDTSRPPQKNISIPLLPSVAND